MKCEFDPSSLVGVPLGMFHCPLCGEMVVAGMVHPTYAEYDEDEYGTVAVGDVTPDRFQDIEQNSKPLDIVQGLDGSVISVNEHTPEDDICYYDDVGIELVFDGINDYPEGEWE